MKASVRCEALDLKGLARAERHGKREDWISQQRRIRKVDPLTLGGATDAEGLNLADLYADHIEGAKMNRVARKTVLHFIIHFPDEMLNDDGPVPGFAAMTRPEREKALLQQAVDFVNRTHGGDAVFAARLDRDEAGLTNIDVFATPKYLKPSKSARREPSLWVSSTRFGEALARKHQEHIRGRLTEAEVKTDRDGNEIPLTSPRAVGMALQEEFHEFFAAVNGVALEERTLKESRSKDRIEVEEWRLRRMEAEAAEALRQRDEARAAADDAERAGELRAHARVVVCFVSLSLVVMGVLGLPRALFGALLLLAPTRAARWWLRRRGLRRGGGPWLPKAQRLAPPSALVNPFKRTSLEAPAPVATMAAATEEILGGRSLPR